MLDKKGKNVYEKYAWKVNKFSLRLKGACLTHPGVTIFCRIGSRACAPSSPAIEQSFHGWNVVEW